MELQPGAYAIKKYIPGQFMAIETVAAAHSNQQPSLAEGAGASAAGEGGGGGVGGWEHICRGAPGRTLEFACGNLFDVANIAQASGRDDEKGMGVSCGEMCISVYSTTEVGFSRGQRFRKRLVLLVVHYYRTVYFCGVFWLFVWMFVFVNELLLTG